MDELVEHIKSKHQKAAPPSEPAAPPGEEEGEKHVNGVAASGVSSAALFRLSFYTSLSAHISSLRQSVNQSLSCFVLSSGHIEQPAYRSLHILSASSLLVMKTSRKPKPRSLLFQPCEDRRNYPLLSAAEPMHGPQPS